MPVPKVTKRKAASNPEEFPLGYYTPTNLCDFSNNPILFNIKHLKGESFDTAHSISSVIGKAFHKAMEVYYGGSDDHIIESESDAVRYGLEVGMTYLNLYHDGWIKYSTTVPTKEKAMEKFAFAFNEYVKFKQTDPGETVVSTEDMLEAFVDIEWRKQQLQLPVKLKGRLDKVVRGSDNRLRIVDYKTCAAFSDENKIDAKKIVQSVHYGLLVAAAMQEMPYSFIFQEVKMTKNKDGSSQVREYEIVYDENDLYFDFYFRYYNDVTRALNGEMVYVPNFNALYDNEIAIIAYVHHLDETEEMAKLMKKHKVTNLTDLLKKKIQRASNVRKLLKATATQFISEKSIDYNTMTNEEKIQTKLLEHGMMLQFDSKIAGATVDLYRYTPSIGLKMSRLQGYVADVEQVLGVSGVRVLAPIPNTSFIGFEVPTSKRTFPKLPTPAGFDLAIGEDTMGNVARFDIRNAPHMLVAGASGSGKSVFLNTLLEQLTELPAGHAVVHLLDPKRVELVPYAKKRNVVAYEDDIMAIHKELEALVHEMNARYETLKKAGARTIEGTDIPYVFVVIDEYGDLIVQNYEHVENVKTGKVFERGARAGEEETKEIRTNISKEIGKNILLLAQKARAAGIHLIISTQRPSVDIVTGSIKANFPTKVCFRTAKAIDSQIVLDTEGAEKLAGKGDMLFSSDEGITRLQGYNV